MLRKKGFYLYKYTEESSYFDPQSTWQPGIECYVRENQVWIPDNLTDLDQIEDYIENHIDDPDLWVDN